MFQVTESEDYTEPWKGLPVAFDGDQIAFICSAGNETRGIRVKENKPFSMWKEYSTRTEFYAAIGGKDKATNYAMEDVQYPFSWEKCRKAIDDTIQSTLDLVETTEYVGYLAEGSPREQWATMQKYKGGREDMLRPKQLKRARQYLIDRWGFEELDGTQFETDDVVCIKGVEGYVMYSNDKDSRQTPGWLLMNSFPEPKKMDSFGWFDVDKSGKTPKPVGEGQCFLAYQCLCGDNSDSYNPRYLVNVRFGPAAAKKVIEGCKTEEELWAAVVDKYKEWYVEPIGYSHAYTGEPMTATWHSVFNEIYLLARMATSFDNPWETGYKLMDRLGIEYE